MLKWKGLLGVSVLSVALMGCGAMGGPNATTKSAGMSAYNQVGISATDGIRRNLSTTGTRTDTSTNFPSSNNSMYKDQSMGVLGTGTTSFGYATYHKTDMHAGQAGSFYVDRNVLARAVSTVVASTPGVQDATVLATDQDLFVGVGGVHDVSTLNKVKLAAWSVAPRYYRVHVTSDAKTINQVKTLVAKSNNRKPFDTTRLQSILKNNTIDMTGTNVTDSGQNITNYNLHHTYPHTNGTTKMSK